MKSYTAWILLPITLVIIGAFLALDSSMPIFQSVEFATDGVLITEASGYKVGVWHVLYRQDQEPFMVRNELIFLPRSRCWIEQALAPCDQFNFDNGDEITVTGRLYEDRLIVDDLASR